MLRDAQMLGLGLTDRQARYVPGSVEGIREALAWAGLDYDHGIPSVGTEQGDAR